MKFIIDGSNVCYWKEDRSFCFSLVLELLIQLKKRGDSFICFFDANIEHQFAAMGKDASIIKDLLRNYMQYFKTVPAGNRADDYIIVAANRYDAAIITNDKFEDEQEKQYASKINWLSKKTQSQRLYKGQVMYFGEDFGDEWVLMIPDLGIEKEINEDVEKKVNELIPLLGDNNEIALESQKQKKEVETRQNDTHQRRSGTILSIIQEHGCGFIQSDEFKSNVYFKLNEIADQSILEIGKPVTFETGTNVKGTIALNIKAIGDPDKNEETDTKTEESSSKSDEKQESGGASPQDKSLNRQSENNLPPEIEIPKDTTLEKVAGDLKAGIGSIVRFLQKNGINITSKPDSKLPEKAYTLLNDRFRKQIHNDEPIYEITEPVEENLTDGYNNMVLQYWWRNLSHEWKEIFLDNAGIIGTPAIDDLIDIIHLKAIDCFNIQVSNIEPVKELKYLKELNCDNTGISDLTPLENLSYLEKLNCSRNYITDLFPLRKLLQLQYLFCDNNEINSLEPLKKLINIVKLDCGHNQIRSINPVQNLEMLEEFWCYHNIIRDISPLKELKNLRELWIHHTFVSSLKPIYDLNKLQVIDASYSRISNTEAHLFKEKHQNTEIYN